LKVLVLGSGGREHALCWAISKSPLCKKLFCIPGNAGIKTLKCIGDSFAPATIAAAVYSGHLAARELQAEPQEDVPFLRERIQI